MPIRHRPNQTLLPARILTTLVAQVIVNFSVCGVLAYPPPRGLVARFA